MATRRTPPALYTNVLHPPPNPPNIETVKRLTFLASLLCWPVPDLTPCGSRSLSKALLFSLTRRVLPWRRHAMQCEIGSWIWRVFFVSCAHCAAGSLCYFFPRALRLCRDVEAATCMCVVLEQPVVKVGCVVVDSSLHTPNLNNVQSQYIKVLQIPILHLPNAVK
jgi:hypothetical protein